MEKRDLRTPETPRREEICRRKGELGDKYLLQNCLCLEFWSVYSCAVSEMWHFRPIKLGNWAAWKMLLKLCTQLKAVIFKTPKDCTWACLQDWASCMLEKVCRSILELPCVSALWVQTPPSTPTRLISIHLCCEHNVDSDFISIDQEPKADWVKALGECPGAGATLCKQQDSSLQALCASQGLWKQKAKDGQRELKDLKEVKCSEMTKVIQECYHVLSMLFHVLSCFIMLLSKVFAVFVESWLSRHIRHTQTDGSTKVLSASLPGLPAPGNFTRSRQRTQWEKIRMKRLKWEN